MEGNTEEKEGNTEENKTHENIVIGGGVEVLVIRYSDGRIAARMIGEVKNESSENRSNKFS